MDRGIGERAALDRNEQIEVIDEINYVNKLDSRPIGIFDSGMGGLTVRAEIVRALPGESTVYFGDGANVPYGPRPKEEITAFVIQAARRLVDRNDVKMLVIACNAATGAAIDRLRETFEIPIIGMEPAVKPAALTTRTGVIGVLATAAAFRGDLYRATSAQYRDSVRLIEQVGEGFVEIVENDRETTPEALETVRHAVEPMLEAGADRIVLGCTHYPFLMGPISRVIDEFADKHGTRAAQIIDSAPAIAHRVAALLDNGGLRAEAGHCPEYQFLTAADEAYRQRLIAKSEK